MLFCENKSDEVAALKEKKREFAILQKAFSDPLCGFEKLRIAAVPEGQ